MAEIPLDYEGGDAYEIVDKDGDFARVERAASDEDGAVVSAPGLCYVSPELAPRFAQAILDAAGAKFSVVANGWQEPGPPPGAYSPEQPY